MRCARALRPWTPAILLLLAGCAARPVPSTAESSGPAWHELPVAERAHPVATLLLPTGEVVVAEDHRNRILLLGAERPPLRFPSPSPEPIAWTALSAAPGLSFYALDGPRGIVHQFDFRGNYLGVAVRLDEVAALHDLGSLDAAGFAVNRAGQAVVSDRQGDRLLVFGPGWSYLGAWGQSGGEAGSWRRPQAVAVGAGEPFLVADAGNRRVVLLDPLGNVLQEREFPQEPRGVAVFGLNRYAVAAGDAVYLLDARLEVLDRRPLPVTAGCRGEVFATAALAGNRNDIFAGEGCSGSVWRLSVRD